MLRVIARLTCCWGIHYGDVTLQVEEVSDLRQWNLVMITAGIKSEDCSIGVLQQM
jgi:hypothetical protein